MRFIGIDPGKGGSIAWIEQGLTAVKSPAMARLSRTHRDTVHFSRKAGDLTERDICDTLYSIKDGAVCVMEKVNAGVWGAGKKGKESPVVCASCGCNVLCSQCGKATYTEGKAKMGVTSAFTFGDGFGLYRGILTALEIPFVMVMPVTWQTFLKCRTGGDKNVSKRKAQQLYPSVKFTHANADAVLIAHYCKLKASELF